MEMITMLYPIRAASKELGISSGTLRRYEREGRISKIKRSPGNRRLYTEENIKNIREYLIGKQN